MKRFHDLAVDRLDLLLIVGGAERRGHQRLGLAAGEQGRAVHARQHAGLDRDRPDLVERAAVEAHAALEDLSRRTFSCRSLKILFASALRSQIVFGQRRQELFEDGIDRA